MPYADLEKAKKYKREWYRKNVKKMRMYHKDWYKKNLKIRREQALTRYYKYKDTIFETLIPVCNNCGNDNRLLLEIDHINGGGNKQRKKKGPSQIFREYAKNPDLAKKELQILCANCHLLKHKTY